MLFALQQVLILYIIILFIMLAGQLGWKWLPTYESYSCGWHSHHPVGMPLSLVSYTGIYHYCMWVSEVMISEWCRSSGNAPISWWSWKNKARFEPCYISLTMIYRLSYGDIMWGVEYYGNRQTLTCTAE